MTSRTGRFARIALAALALFAPLGCAATGALERVDEDAKLPRLAELGPGWNTLSPGGETTCARGAPFHFYVRPGIEERVLIEFRGGGACWNEATCAPGSGLFEETAEKDAFMTGASEPAGIDDHDDARNPFANWHHVYIPYCTGDIHWGDNVITYGQGTGHAFSIRHKGAVNTRAVLGWVYDNFPHPEKVFVAGCSAGAYGSIMWSAHVRRHYEGARVYQMGDSGTGVITERFFRESYPSWNPAESYPLWIPGLRREALTDLASLYEAVGRQYPEMRLSQVSSKFDEEQAFRYRLMGGRGGVGAWSRLMTRELRSIADEIPNFHYYIGPGKEHCILPSDRMYTTTVEGERFTDWLARFVDDRPVEDVAAGAFTR